MKVHTLSAWVQVFTAVAVMVGLGLVIFELRQTKELAIADLMSQQFTFGNEIDNTMMGENPVESLVAACMGREITATDALVLENYYWGMFDKIALFRTTTVRADLGWTWENFADSQLEVIFSTQQGRIWWETARPTLARTHNYILPIGDAVLSRIGPPDCAARVQRYLNTQSDV